MPQEQPLFNKILTDENNKILVKTPSDNCLDVMSGNKFNEKDVAANNPNGLASVVTQEIHTDSEMAILGVHELLTSFSSTYVISLTPFRALCVKQ